MNCDRRLCCVTSAGSVLNGYYYANFGHTSNLKRTLRTQFIFCLIPTLANHVSLLQATVSSNELNLPESMKPKSLRVAESVKVA